MLEVVFFQNLDGFAVIDSLFHLEILGTDCVFVLSFKTEQNIAIVMCCPKRKFQEHKQQYFG